MENEIMQETMNRPKYQISNREYQEILLAQTYVDQFKHGTGGHLAYTVIARLMEVLNEVTGTEHVIDVFEVVDTK